MKKKYKFQYGTLPVVMMTLIAVMMTGVSVFNVVRIVVLYLPQNASFSEPLVWAIIYALIAAVDLFSLFYAKYELSDSKLTLSLGLFATSVSLSSVYCIADYQQFDELFILFCVNGKNKSRKICLSKNDKKDFVDRTISSNPQISYELRLHNEEN